MSEASKAAVLYDVIYSAFDVDNKTIKESIKVREGVSLETAYNIGSRLADALYLKQSTWAVKEGEQPVEGDKYAWLTITPGENNEWVFVAPVGVAL